MIQKDAPAFPAGIQFADIMIEDKHYSDPAASEEEDPGGSHAVAPSFFYKQISRFINPELL